MTTEEVIQYLNKIDPHHDTAHFGWQLIPGNWMGIYILRENFFYDAAYNWPGTTGAFTVTTAHHSFKHLTGFALFEKLAELCPEVVKILAEPL